MEPHVQMGSYTQMVSLRGSYTHLWQFVTLVIHKGSYIFSQSNWGFYTPERNFILIQWMLIYLIMDSSTHMWKFIHTQSVSYGRSHTDGLVCALMLWGLVLILLCVRNTCMHTQSYDCRFLESHPFSPPHGASKSSLICMLLCGDRQSCLVGGGLAVLKREYTWGKMEWKHRKQPIVTYTLDIGNEKHSDV